MIVIDVTQIRKRIDRDRRMRTTLGRVDDLNHARCYDPAPDHQMLKMARDRGYLDLCGRITRKGWDFYFGD